MTMTSLHHSRIALARCVLVFFAMLACAPATAHIWCVSTAADLRAKLLLAQSNGEDDTIKLVRGTYATGSNTFQFLSTETFGLAINGGFDAGCTQSSQDPRGTILDGGNAVQVFIGEIKGNLALRYLTIQNGKNDDSAGGGFYVHGVGAGSSVVLGINILRNNSSAYATCVGSIVTEGAVHINGNLIVENHTPAAGGLSVDAGASSLVYVTNNTIANNTTGSAASGFVYVGGSNTAVPGAYFTNNIMWNNVAGSDVQFFGTGMQFNNNDIHVIAGFQTAGSGLNVSVDPGFVSSSDYHLAATSPLLGTGTFTPPGGLPTVDLEGHARDSNGDVDLGAYERGDEIFADAFEP